MSHIHIIDQEIENISCLQYLISHNDQKNYSIFDVAQCIAHLSKLMLRYISGSNFPIPVKIIVSFFPFNDLIHVKLLLL